jgi:DEAD/DEAH box helicase domain-containing protein
MSGIDSYENNTLTSVTGHVLAVSTPQSKIRTHTLEVQDRTGNTVSATVWAKSPAAEISWTDKQWYDFQNVLVKQRGDTTEIHLTQQTTVEQTEPPSDVAMPAEESESSSPVQENKLTELYEAFRSLCVAIHTTLEDDSVSISLTDRDEPLVQYYFVLKTVLSDDEYLPARITSYRSQQDARNPFGIDAYRDQYGNGDWITEYHCIEVEQFNPRTQEQFLHRNIISEGSALVRPVAPQSKQPLDEVVTSSDELKQALKLLGEFPATPSGAADASASNDQLPVRAIYAKVCHELDDQACLEPTAIPHHYEQDPSDEVDKEGTDKKTHSIDETLEWLQETSGHSNELVHRKTQSDREPQFEEPIPTSSPVTEAAHRLGITALYTHQQAALEAATSGDHVVIATETASGKSLPYRLLALDRAQKHQTTTLYIAPTKALINDQAAAFEEFVNALPDDSDISVDIYTGDTSDKKRKRIRRDPPDILLMTPELVHMSLLPHHSRWQAFLHRLETIVIDEIHEFGGLFGSHLSLVCRRLNRLLDQYNQSPSYYCCSATIGNPVEHASAVTGRPADEFSLIDTDTSGRGRRFWLLYNPGIKQKGDDSDGLDSGEHPDDCDEIRERTYRRDEYQCTACGNPGGANGSTELHLDHIVSPEHGGRHDLPNLRTLCSDCYNNHSPSAGETTHSSGDTTPPDVSGEVQAGVERRSNHPISIRLFTELIIRGHQTLVFTKARQGAAQYVKDSADRLEQMGYSDMKNKITAYHAALEDAERETIEAGLQTGDIRGVWSTNALELGIDIGSLDAVIIDGHPGTNMSLFQQTGRGGRGEDDCLILFVAQPDPLDQYWISNPDQVFEDPPADAQVNPDNIDVLPEHIVSAADEYPLSMTDEAHFGTLLSDLVPSLTQSGRLARTTNKNGIQWESAEGDTQYDLPLRGDFGTEYDLIDKTRNDRIGSLTFPDVLRDCHPEAIYAHQKRTYRVEAFDETRCDIHLSQKPDVTGFTKPLFDQSVEVRNEHQTKSLTHMSDASVGYADMVYQETLDGYLKFDHPDDEDPTEKAIDEPLPDYQLRTNGLYITIPSELENRMQNMVDSQDGLLAGVHAIEHTLQSLFPLEVLCSANDITGLSIVNHQHTSAPTIFLLDNVSGGAGLTQTGYKQIDPLLQKAHSAVRSCNCQSGCPSCIYLGTCRSRNRVLNKELAEYVLRKMS